MKFMRIFVLLCLGLLSALPIGAGAQTTNVSVGYQVTTDWGAGYTANWYLTNNSSVTITNWVFQFDQPVTSFPSVWNCALAAGSTATHKIFTNLGYNASIAPGTVLTFGYNGAPGGLVPPTNYILNGLVLNGSGNGGGTVSLPSLTVADAGVARGNSGTTSLSFVVTLSAAATNQVAVSYTTADGSAVAGTDYLAAAGTLNFAAGITQQVSRMIGNDEFGGEIGIALRRVAGHDGMEIVDVAAQVGHGIRCAEKILCGGCAKGYDDFRTNDGNLPHEERAAGVALITLWRAVLRRAALDHVGDVNVFATNAHGGDHVIEQLPGASYEGLALRIFIRAWTFTDEHDAGVRVADAEDNVGARLAQFAAGTIAKVCANHLQRGRLVAE